MFTRLADAYRSIGQLAAAEAFYRKSLSVGYDKFSLFGLSKLYAVCGETNEVVRCYRQLVTNEEEDGRFFGAIASRMIEHNRHSDALSFYQAAYELQKNNQDISQKLAIQAEKLQLQLCCNSPTLG